MAQVHRLTRTWSPKLEVDGVPIAWDASLRHYRGGHIPDYGGFQELQPSRALPIP